MDFTKEEYQTAEKIWNDWRPMGGIGFDQYIKAKAKPVDPLYEKFQAFSFGALDRYDDGEIKAIYENFKGCFKDELNENAAYETVNTLWASFDGIWGTEELKHIDATLQRLENKQ